MAARPQMRGRCFPEACPMPFERGFCPSPVKMFPKAAAELRDIDNEASGNAMHRNWLRRTCRAAGSESLAAKSGMRLCPRRSRPWRKLGLGDIQPAAAFGRAMYFRPLRKAERPLRRKRLAKRRGRMHVQAVHRKRVFFSPCAEISPPSGRSRKSRVSAEMRGDSRAWLRRTARARGSCVDGPRQMR